MAPEMSPLVAAIVAQLRNPLPPAPAPYDEPATPLVLFERAKLAGFSDGQAATLATFLSPEAVVRACELVEGGCDPHTAGRIVI